MSKRYDLEEVERGLTMLALKNGNSRHAERELANTGNPIPAATLTGWKNRTHAARYEEIVRETVPRVHAKLAGEMEDVLRRAITAMDKAVCEADRADYKGSKEAASATKELAITAGILTDKSRLIRGEPTDIRREERSIPEILRHLATDFGHVFPNLKDSPLLQIPESEITESTAEELPEA